jgi:hypothetical protein
MGSGNAALFHRLFNTLGGLPARQVTAWASWLAEHQDEDGYIFDRWLTQADLSSSGHSWEHTRSHNSRIATMGLLALGRRPPRRMNFIHALFDPAALQRWLDVARWDKIWWFGNEVFDLGLYLGIESEVFGDARARAAIEVLLDILTARQEPATGYWETARNSPVEAMAGAFHLYPLFIQFGRAIPYKERIIDSTLALVREPGCFWPDSNGLYTVDFDAVHILANMAAMTDYRRADIEAVMRSVQRNVLAQMLPNGGFPAGPKDFGFNCYVRQATAEHPAEPALWCSFFRYATLALIDVTLHGRRPHQWDFRGILHCNLYPAESSLIPKDDATR